MLEQLRQWYSDEAYIACALQWAAAPDHHIVTQEDIAYPRLLKEIYGAPSVLYVAGDKTFLSSAQIAMVGSRNPSHAGLDIAREFAGAFSTAGLCVTSGMALGIDAASHYGALQTGGKTIAVMGCGLLHCYPKTHRDLFEKIKAAGALVSEFPLTEGPRASFFPQRNRIISGLSLGTLVVEAAMKSGSLITARCALEQNRDVFAVPGSIHNALSTGCLSLIQQGAHCVTCPDDVLFILNCTASILKNDLQPPSTQVVTSSCTLDCQEQQVLACIDDTPTTVDQICLRCRLSAQIVSIVLSALELKMAIQRMGAGYVKNRGF